MTIFEFSDLRLCKHLRTFNYFFLYRNNFTNPPLLQRLDDLFPTDLFYLLGEEDRPPYRWFCLGPKRSGTTVHKDPLGTAAWNAVISGAKRWVLFEPHVPRKIVKGRDVILPGEDDEAINYFDVLLPRIKLV